ncbi:MAG TPA: hypothetical protein VF810_02585 [Patescibacteria group bacterium]
MTNSQYFNLDIEMDKYHTLIDMEMLVNILQTGKLPFTLDLLKTHLPGVLKTKCFNENNLCFEEEVKNTEIAHLFEHILLENLYQIKIREGFRNVMYRGDTSWNWKKDKRGIFHIYLSCSQADKNYFEEALNKTISLINLILDSYFYYPEFQSKPVYETVALSQ